MIAMRMTLAVALVNGACWFAVVARAQDNDAFGNSNIGERLFLETRFAQFFFTNSGGNANFALDQRRSGDEHHGHH